MILAPRAWLPKGAVDPVTGLVNNSGSDGYVRDPFGACQGSKGPITLAGLRLRAWAQFMALELYRPSAGRRRPLSLQESGRAALPVCPLRLDGPENTDFNYGSYLVQPSIDALQEFNVETGTYSAEFGHNMTQMNVVTKSGTNQYHGSLFEFLRNTAMDARNFFQPASTPVSILKRNQFGFVLSGPIRIPKVFNGHDKLFFLFNYEGQRQNQQNLAYGSVPLPAYFTGNFSPYSTVIYDPAQRVLNAAGTAVTAQAPFPGNIIPASRIAPQSALAASLFPAPNATPTNVLNYVYSNNYVNNAELIKIDHDAELARVDWQANAALNFPVPLIQSRRRAQLHAGQQLGVRRYGYREQRHHSSGHAGEYLGDQPHQTERFPKSGVWEPARVDQRNTYTGVSASTMCKKLGIPYVLDTPEFWGIPVITLSNFSGPADPQNGPTEAGARPSRRPTIFRGRWASTLLSLRGFPTHPLQHDGQ